MGGISFLVGIVDFIAFLGMSDDNFNKKYNTIKPAQQRTVNVSGDNLAEELEKLHTLKEKGILTDEEFQAKKSKLL